MSVNPELRDATYQWIAGDFYEYTQQELQSILAKAMAGDEYALADLTDRMAGPLTFGTAGLRAAVRAGNNGMNNAVVAKATAGVGNWLAAQGKTGIVVVGRDARHGSESFCEVTAAVLTAQGFTVKVLPGPLPTPLVPYAVRKLGAIAGIQITASHNPPADNGYKLYDDSGAQIVPPSDGQIEQAISELGDAITIARAESGWEVLDTELVDRYVSEVSALAGNEKNVRIALTPMHGVGGATAVAALRAAGFTDVHVVTEQFEPNPDFPTVAFPNPEEPGAADLLLALAKEIDADIAIALDPDADRCAVGVNDNGVWRMLRGDETGVILGEHVLHTSAITPKLVATTIVSSSLLGEIARTYGAEYKETLTGFKYLARAGADLIFAYEEALGLCVAPSLVSDKDGISAAVVAASYAAELKVAGTDFLGALAKLSEKYGHYATEQIALRFTDLSLIGKLMTKLRTSPPEEIAGIKVTAEDLLPDADVLRYIGEGLRVVVRPSGTEPKLKAYVQVVGDTAEAAAETLTEVSTAVRKLL